MNNEDVKAQPDVTNRALTIVRRILGILLWMALGCVLGAVALAIHMARGGPPLQPWHTVILDSEFSVLDRKAIDSFDDYRRLEDRLFAELDERVTARTDTGPGQRLVRYSRGSAADPGRWQRNWNRSVEWRADQPVGGVLLLHGMSDGPYSLRALGQALNRQNYQVLAVRLPGHGTIPSGLLSVNWEDMAAVVRLAMKHLSAKVGPRPIHVIGYSTGAPLALNLTLNALDGGDAPLPASLVLISPAIGIHPAAFLAGWTTALAALPGLEKIAWTQVVPEFDPFKYNSFTSNAAHQVHRLTGAVTRRLQALASARRLEQFPPTLVALSVVDDTVSTDAVIDNLLDRLPPERHEMILFDINRNRAKATILVSDPGPLTARLMADDDLPFGLTLVSNESDESDAVISRRKPARSATVQTESLGLAWPRGVISLSHIALPFPIDDPLYGRTRPRRRGTVFLGQVPLQGERGLLAFSADWLLRLRHNPFYPFLERRVLQWIDQAGDRAGDEAASQAEVRPVAANPPP